MHFGAEPLEYLPFSQDEHLSVKPEEYFPASQALQVVAASGRLVADPDEHVRHSSFSA
jgi:hypothetical protein